MVQAEFISGGLEQTSMLKKHLYGVAFQDPKKCLSFEKVRFSIWAVVSRRDIETEKETERGVSAHYPIPIHLTKPIKNNEILNELSSSLFNFPVSLKPFQLL